MDYGHRLSDYAQHLDGLVLQGGADVNPMSPFTDMAGAPKQPPSLAVAFLAGELPA